MCDWLGFGYLLILSALKPQMFKTLKSFRPLKI